MPFELLKCPFLVERLRPAFNGLFGMHLAKLETTSTKLSVQMETIERNVLIENEDRKPYSYKVKFQRNFTSPSGSNSKLKFVVSQNRINVKLTNETLITALRFEISFKDKFTYKPIAFSERLQDLNTYINFEETSLTLVILDIDGKGIASGDGTIASIPIDDQQEFQVVAAYASTRTTGIKEIDYTIANENAQEYISLEQNDPNPFSTSTRIDFQIADDTEVKVIIYDVGGALVRTLLDSKLEMGLHTVEWDGKDDSESSVESGIYLYKLFAGIYSVTKKMVYLK
jgi:hypothetical protein